MLHPSHIERMAREVREAEAEGRPPNPEALDPAWGSRPGWVPKREWRHAPFILARHLLDRTQPADLGYTGIEAARARWVSDHPEQPEPRHGFWKPPYPDCPVSHSKNLELYVLGYSILSNQVGGESRRNAVLIPEIGSDGAWRCRHVYCDGSRCLSYAGIDAGFICCEHKRIWKEQSMSSGGETGYEIQDLTLSALVERYRHDPNIRSVSGEVAIQRSMLALLLQQINLKASTEGLDSAQMNAVMQVSKMVTEACERMVAIESKLTAKMSIEQLSTIATAMFEVVCEVCQPTPEQAHRLAAKWAKITDPKRTVMVDAETGEMVTRESELRTVMAEPPPDNRITMTGGTTGYSPEGRVLPDPVKRAPPQEKPLIPPPGVRERLIDLATDATRWGV